MPPTLPAPASLTNFCQFATLNSSHTGGSNFVFADGHVAFLTFAAGNTLIADGTKTMFEALASRASGELATGN